MVCFGFKTEHKQILTSFHFEILGCLDYFRVTLRLEGKQCGL